MGRELRRLQNGGTDVKPPSQASPGIPHRLHTVTVGAGEGLHSHSPTLSSPAFHLC